MNLLEQKDSNGDLASMPDPLIPLQKQMQACIQCGTCSGSCPNAFAMDLTPRQLWYNLIMGDRTTIFQSITFSLCSSCYYCTLRCPRGLPLTETMAALFPDSLGHPDGRTAESCVEVEVRDSLEKAMKILKQKMSKEGILQELKRRRFHEKPSLKRKRKTREARKRLRREMKRRVR